MGSKMEPHAVVLDWMIGCINAILSIDDLLRCQEMLEPHKNKILALWNVPSSGDDVRNFGHSILFVWKTEREEVVDEVITVVEPGSYLTRH